MPEMTTETSTTDASNVTLGPDWLRSKPVAVFSHYRYGQEELLNLWSCTPQCPQSIVNIPDLGAAEPVRPACLSSYQEESQEVYRVSGSERGRGRPAGRSRGGGVSRGGQRSRYYEPPRSTADSDNWRRRDPDPVPEPALPELPDPGADLPPSYPPFPSRSFSPTHIDNRETNSWKRTEAEQQISPPQPTQRGSPPQPTQPPLQPTHPVTPPQPTQLVAPQQPPQSVAPPQPPQLVSPMQPNQPVVPPLQQPVEPPAPPHHPELLQFSATAAVVPEESPETMLRNISKSLYDVDQGSTTEPFNSHIMFSPFSDTQGSGGRIYGNVGAGDVAASIASQLSSTSTSAVTPTSPLDMPGLFNRDPMSPAVSYTSTQLSTRDTTSQRTRDTTSPQQTFPTSPPFPSLAEIGKSLNNPGGERNQGFLPPAAQHPPGQHPPTPTAAQQLPTFTAAQQLPTFTAAQQLPTPTVRTPPPDTYRADEMWFYLDPKNNTQGPFDSVKMFGWFKEGYFGMDLKIRRAADSNFTKLETMIQQCGRIPFKPDDKLSPPPGTQNLAASQLATQNLATSQLSHMAPSTAAPVWNTVTSIWGNAETSNNLLLGGPPNKYREDQKVKRAEQMRLEIERAMALEQQRKQDIIQEDENRQKTEHEKDNFLLAQRQLMEQKLAEEQKQTEEQRKRLLEEEMKKNKLFEEESAKIRLEKERLEQERIKQAEKVRYELEEAEKARHALEQERLKLERERQLVKQKEEELRRRDEAEKKKREEQARVEEERRAAKQAAAEAKALAKAQEEAVAAQAAAIKEARRQADEKARREEMIRKEAAELAAAAKREDENAWGNRVSYSPTAQENTNPWANIPPMNVTKSSTRTPVPTSKGWAKPDSGPVSIPLSQIQQDEVKMKNSSTVVGGRNRDSNVTEPVMPRPTGWATAKQPPTKTRSLAEIQREEEKRTAQLSNFSYAQNNSWNPVAGMLEDEAPRPTPKKQTKPQQAKPQPQQKAQTRKSKTQQPLIDMFSSTSPKDEFTIWCESQVSSFKNQHIDVPTFISFLRDVESPREVREYVVSYLGDTLSTDRFIQEFVARRKSSKEGAGAAAGGGTTQSQGNKSNNSKGTSGSTQQQQQQQQLQQQQQQQPSSRRGKRKKMQKVNAASLLGINCTASSDARNRGDIDSVATQ